MRLWSRRSGIVVGLVIGLALGLPAIADALPQLAEAIRRGQLDVARTLLKKPVDVNEKLPDGTTALHWAVERDDADLVTGLINAKADPNVASTFGVTPLLLACRNGNPAIVSTLVRAGAIPNTPSRTGETPLMTAALDRPARSGERPARSRRRPARQGAPRRADRADVGHRRRQCGRDEAAPCRWRCRPPSPPSGASRRCSLPRGMATSRSRRRCCSRRALGVNAATPDGTTALVIATIRSQLDYARFLLELGADPKLGPGFTPLHWVAGDWTSELAGEKTTVRPEGTEWDALLPLLSDRQHEDIKLLIAKGADVNARAKAQPRPSVGVGSGGGGFRGGNRLAARRRS